MGLGLWAQGLDFRVPGRARVFYGISLGGSPFSAPSFYMLPRANHECWEAYSILGMGDFHVTGKGCLVAARN